MNSVKGLGKSSPLSAVVLSFQHLVVNSATSQYLCGMNTKSFSTQHSIPGIDLHIVCLLSSTRFVFLLYVLPRLPARKLARQAPACRLVVVKGADFLALCPASTSSKKTGLSSSSMALVVVLCPALTEGCSFCVLLRLPASKAVRKPSGLFIKQQCGTWQLFKGAGLPGPTILMLPPTLIHTLARCAFNNCTGSYFA